jgi:hypothetical protein
MAFDAHGEDPGNDRRAQSGAGQPDHVADVAEFAHDLALYPCVLGHRSTARYEHGNR